METYNINGVEIQYDTFDLVNLELYTNGVTEIAEVGKRVKEMIQEDPAKNGIKAIRMMCKHLWISLTCFVAKGRARSVSATM